MESELKQKIDMALKLACKDDSNPRIELDDVAPDRVAGVVLSTVFAPLSPHERQDLIWDELDKALTSHERTRITFILTDTPEEYRLLTQARAAGG